MDVLDFQDRIVPLPLPSDSQWRRLAPDLNKVTCYAALLLLRHARRSFVSSSLPLPRNTLSISS